jgi:hypothetical protein
VYDDEKTLGSGVLKVSWLVCAWRSRSIFYEAITAFFGVVPAQEEK